MFCWCSPQKLLDDFFFLSYILIFIYFLNMKLLSEVAPCLLVIQIQIQAVWFWIKAVFIANMKKCRRKHLHQGASKVKQKFYVLRKNNQIFNGQKYRKCPQNFWPYLSAQGGFQLYDLIISRVKTTWPVINLSALIGWNILSTLNSVHAFCSYKKRSYKKH